MADWLAVTAALPVILSEEILDHALTKARRPVGVRYQRENGSSPGVASGASGVRAVFNIIAISV